MTPRICPIPVFLLLTGLSWCLAQDNPTPTPAPKKDAQPVEKDLRIPPKGNPALPTLFLVGDSTMKVGTAGQRGWGDEIAVYFDTGKINVINWALGGRSSRTFQAEGRWDLVLAEMKPGDFAIFQFGHNDSSPINDNSRARGTIKGGGEETEEIDNMLTHQHEVVHSFGWYMRKYATDTKAKGATPIICSLIPRKSWKDGKINRDSYGKWAADAAQATGSLFVNLNEAIAEKYEAFGQDKVNPLFADSGTHTTVEGAQLNASCVVAGLKGLKDNPLQNYLSAKAAVVEPFADKSPASAEQPKSEPATGNSQSP